ncbi:hypothetical protein OG21DRAFT_1521680 [Imleria badia]|nr:hypothetical protein OG21DRAFT_1521680 [Imleria badia]
MPIQNPHFSPKDYRSTETRCKTFAGFSAVFTMRRGSGNPRRLHVMSEREEGVYVWTVYVRVGSQTTSSRRCLSVDHEGVFSRRQVDALPLDISDLVGGRCLRRFVASSMMEYRPVSLFDRLFWDPEWCTAVWSSVNIDRYGSVEG